MKLVRRPRVTPRIPFAPMGDIAFLLIIFFMITSVFIKEAHVDITLPESVDIAKLENSQMAVTLDASGTLWFQGSPVHVDELEDLVAAEISQRKDPIILLKIDANLRQEQFAPVLTALGGTEAKLAWIGEQP